MHLVNMKNDFFKHRVLFFLLFVCFFKNGHAQIKAEQELIFNDDTLFVFNKNGQRGLGTDTNSVDFKYDSIVLNHHRSMILASKDGKWGTIGNDNKVVLPLKYDKLVPIHVSDDLIVAALGEKWGLINERGKRLIPFEYDTVAQSKVIKIRGKEYRTFIVKKNGKFGIVNNKNKILVPVEYDQITNWIEYGPRGHYILKNGKKGFVNEEGNLLIPCVYDGMNYDFNLKLFLVKQNNKYGLVNEHNNPFLPVVFNKIYLDVPIFYDETEDSAKIVVQRMDSTWHYLNIKDGSVLQTNVPKDTVFENYKTELFGEVLMDDYMQKVRKEEGGFIVGLDTFHQQLVDEIMASKSGIQIDFPDLHKTSIDFIPDFIHSMSIFKIRNYLLSRGFEVIMTGGRMDDRNTQQQLFFRVSLPDRECLFEISFHKTYRKNEYKIIESLKCIAQDNSYMRIPRYHNLHKD